MRDDETFAALALRYLDGATTPEEDAALNAELGASEEKRERFVELCRQRGRLVEALKPAAKGKPVTRRTWLYAAAAALLAAGIGTLLLPREAAEPVVRVQRVEGTATRVGPSGRAPLRPGDALGIGDGLETDGNGRVVLAFDDRSTLKVGPGSALSGLDVRGGKRLFVARGAVEADVVRQALPLTVRTPEGEAKVLGTVFRLEVAGGSTRLEVEKGLVRLTRLEDRKSTDVAAGQYAVASAGTAPAARPLAHAKIAAMAPGSWLAIPNSKLSSVVPDKARFPGIQGRVGSDGVVAAWSGGAFDTRRNRLVVWGGGYTDYHGNELYAFSLETLAWERLTEPNPSPNLNHDANLDGTPNSRATYNGLAYLPDEDRLFALGGAVAGNGYAVCDRPWLFDFAAKTWSRRSPGGENPEAGMGALCAYDPAGRKVWWGDGKGLSSYDVAADRWTRHADDAFYYATGAVDPKRGLFVAVGNGGVAAYELRRPVRQVWATTGGDAVVKRPNPGLDYDPVRERLTAWAGGAVCTLDPATKAWTARDAPGAPPPTPNGIFGRWRYVPSLDAFILVVSAAEDVRLYKP
jgi:ferric-dicitrate binding protein FerR (iron transport regulator)